MIVDSSLHTLVQILIAFLVFASSFAYPDGPPTSGYDSACKDMEPFGHYGTAQKDTDTYTIIPDADSYYPRRIMKIRLVGQKVDEIFRGFLLQARNSADEPVGRFIDAPENTKLAECSAMHDTVRAPACMPHIVAQSHSARAEFKSVEVMWEAPAVDVGEVTFTSTFVKEYSLFWPRQQSQSIVFVEMLPPETEPQTTSTAKPTTAAPTSSPKSETTTSPKPYSIVAAPSSKDERAAIAEEEEPSNGVGVNTITVVLLIEYTIMAIATITYAITTF